MKRLTSAVLVASLLAQAPLAQAQSQEGVLGGVLGAIVGGVVGNQTASRGNRTAGTAIGALAGLVLGGLVGEAFSRRDQQAMSQGYMYIDQAQPGECTQWAGDGYGGLHCFEDYSVYEYRRRSVQCRPVRTVVVTRQSYQRYYQRGWNQVIERRSRDVIHDETRMVCHVQNQWVAVEEHDLIGYGEGRHVRRPPVDPYYQDYRSGGYYQPQRRPVYRDEYAPVQPRRDYRRPPVYQEQPRYEDEFGPGFEE